MASATPTLCLPFCSDPAAQITSQVRGRRSGGPVSPMGAAKLLQKLKVYESKNASSNTRRPPHPRPHPVARLQLSDHNMCSLDHR